MNTSEEQHFLKISIAVTLAIGSAGAVFGIIISSQSIIFDSFYSLIDVAMTGIAFLVSRLVARGETRRFQYGFWHLEPMLAALNATVLAASCAYAFLTAMMSLLHGGHEIEFGLGAIYALASAICCFAMAFYARRNARRLGSELLALDARSFLVGGILSGGLLVSFVTGLMLTGTRHTAVLPYIDPAILMVVTACVLPLPLSTVWHAMKEVFQLAPPKLDDDLRNVMDSITRRHGFLGFESHVAKAGRAYFIEVDIVVPPDFAGGAVRELDLIRQEIAASLPTEQHQNWLTIVFTADRKWL